MLSDDELAKIRQRKIELMMERAKRAQVLEPTANGIVNELTDTNFWSMIGQTKTAFIDFYGAWCQPCKMLTPIMQELAAENKGKVFFGKLDVDKNLRIARQFGIQSVPMVFAFKHGKPVGNLPGLRPYDAYDLLIEKLLEAS